MIYLALAESDTLWRMFEHALDLVSAGAPFASEEDSKRRCGERRIRIAFSPKGAEPARHFDTLASEIGRLLEEDTAVTVLVDSVRPFEMNPLRDGYDALLSALILAFPEVRWLFAGIRGYPERNEVAGKGTSDEKNRIEEANKKKQELRDLLDGFRRAHGLHRLFEPWQTPLFDGSGLRDWVRERIREDNKQRKALAYIPRRTRLAAALDEEPDYAFLHAYTAYRFGYRALALDRWKAVEAVFKKDTTNVDLALEDLYLNFPDGGDGMSDLEKRYKELPGLKCVPNHVIVTSDQRTPGDGDKQERNRRVKRDWKQEHRNGFMKWVHKPHGGIFALWREAGLFQRLKHGLAEGFKWPPRWKAIEREAAQQNEVGGHSSPGILLLIARRLVLRAERMLADGAIITAEEAVRGAVLATDALELLGGKTPTAAAEALALKHQFEIHAECQFVGVEYRIRLRDRFEDIARNAKAISRWFNRKEQARAAMNIELDVINRMVGVFRQYNQFDEEMQCLARLRHLDHSLYMHRSWRIVWWPFLRYVEFLMRSFPNFLLAIVAWMLPLGVILAMDPGVENGQQVVEATINAFFANNPHTGEIVTMIFTTVAAVAGIAHLGIFISHLYTLVSKR